MVLPDLSYLDGRTTEDAGGARARRGRRWPGRGRAQQASRTPTATGFAFTWPDSYLHTHTVTYVIRGYT